MDDWKFRPARDHGLSFRERLRSAAREDGLVPTAVRSVWWWWVRCQLAAWHRLTIHGREHLPDAFPFVVVANHTSHLDALVLTATIPWWLRAGTCPLAAGDVFFESPARGALAAALTGALPVWRGRHTGRAFRDLRQRLQDGACGYVLFPEGTRSRNGHMAAFKSGVGMLVAGTSVPVVPCYLDGCFRALPSGARAPRRERISVHIGRPLSFEGTPNDRDGWEVVARKLEDGVTAARPRCADKSDAPSAHWDETNA